MTEPPDDPHAPGGPSVAGLVSGSAAVVSMQGRKRKPAPPPPVHGNWEQLLRHKADGELTRDPGNAALIVTNDPEWAGALQYDCFADRVSWTRVPPEVPGLVGPAQHDALADHHIVYVQHWLARHRGVTFTDGAVRAAIAQSARAHTVHPVREYLTALKWDGKLRIHRWLQDYLGAGDDEYIHHCGRMWLISAVARILRPGCQADHVLVLEGAQGAGKSTVARILGGEWYLSNLPDLQNKDASAALRGKWIAEIAELDAMRRAELTRINEFITRPVDSYRPAYGMFTIDQPRQVVFIGTTNEEHYLKDHTGARRFWPVTVGEIDTVGLAAIRDQLWAEATACYQQGEAWHPTREQASFLAAAQAARFQVDEWEPRVAAWLNSLLKPQNEVSVGDILSGAMGLDAKHHDRSGQTRIGAIMTRLKWPSIRHKEHGTVVRRYHRPLDQDPARGPDALTGQLGLPTG